MIYLSGLVCMSTNSERVIRCRKNLKRKAVAFLGGSCTKCGYSKYIEALEFHHRDPTQKDFSFAAKGLCRKFEVVRAELLKCDLLCANCHRELHADLRVSRTKEEKRGRPQLKWPSLGELNALVQEEPLSSIAIRYSVSRATIRNWCKVLGVKLPEHASRLPGSKKPGFKSRTLWPSPDLLKILVWKKPVLQVAKDLGVSDVAVQKRCKRLGIETPPRGYWAQRESLLESTSRFPPVSELRVRVANTSYKRVAGELGCDSRTLRNYILRCT